MDPARSSVRYRVEHKLHPVDGASREVEGRALVKADGIVQAMVRVPVRSFRSGDANRDAHMEEALEAGRLPFVVFRGLASLGAGRDPGAQVVLDGEVDLHGTRRPLRVPVALERRLDGTLRALASFSVSLEAHGIERPSLLFVQVEDACAIEVDLVLREEAR